MQNILFRLLGASGALALLSCAGVAAGPGSAAASSFEGTVVSVDTKPWTYDGNAVVLVDSPEGRVEVHLPARWNLCKAAPVDVGALEPGTRVRVTAERSDEGALVVCQAASHAVVPVD